MFRFRLIVNLTGGMKTIDFRAAPQVVTFPTSNLSFRFSFLKPLQLNEEVTLYTEIHC